MWQEIAALYGMGALTEPPRAIAGGLQHRLFRINATQATYAVKVLNPSLLAEEGRRDRYAHAEQIAQAAARAGLPAVTALAGIGGPLLTVGDVTVMVFAWHDGATLPPTPASPEASRQIGVLLGRLHASRLDVPGLAPLQITDRPDEHWAVLSRQAQKERVPWAEAVAAALPDVIIWNQAAQAALTALGDKAISTHRDMDQKNVLWTDPQTPWLLDWEGAGLMHPMMELMGTALNWAGLSAGLPSQETFTAFLAGYRQAAPINAVALKHAAVAVLEKWLVWLEFNLRRSLAGFRATAAEQAMACGAASHALATLTTLAADTETRLRWCDSAAPLG